MKLSLNPVTRGDLRARLASPKVLWAVRLYLGALGILAVLAIPPEVGGLQALKDADLVRAALGAQLMLTAYLTSALAVAEIGVEGEKGIADLAMTSFGARTIALGKLWSSMVFAAALVLVALPVTVLMAPAARGPFAAVFPTLGVITAVAAVVGTLGTWLASAVESDLWRTLLHWGVLAAVFAGPRLLEGPAAVIGPFRLLAAASGAGPAAWPLALGPYLVLAALATWLTARLVRRQRMGGAPVAAS